MEYKLPFLLEILWSLWHDCLLSILLSPSFLFCWKGNLKLKKRNLQRNDTFQCTAWTFWKKWSIFLRQHSINFLPWKENIFIFFSLGQLPFGTKLIVKLKSTCLVKLIFQHVLNVRKTSRIAKFHGLELRHREHIEEIVALEINSFETFEKQGPGACLSKVLFVKTYVE